MIFHKSDRGKYVCSGRKLRKEMLQTLAEYFEAIYGAQLSNGTVPHHQLDQIRADTKCEMRHELEEH